MSARVVCNNSHKAAACLHVQSPCVHAVVVEGAGSVVVVARRTPLHDALLLLQPNPSHSFYVEGSILSVIAVVLNRGAAAPLVALKNSRGATNF